MKIRHSLLAIATVFSLDPITIMAHEPNHFGVFFDTSMAQTHYYDREKTKHDPAWQKAISLYNHYLQKDRYEDSHVKIPKIIHRIWLGSPLPDKCKKLGQTWAQHHPGWEIKLWTEKEINEFGLQNRQLYDAAKNYGEKSDIARYEILERFGGLYIDTDFECLQPFDYLHDTCTFYTGLNCFSAIELFNGMIGSVPGHPILKLCIQRLKEPHRLLNRANDAMSILARTGPYFFTECIFQCINSMGAHEQKGIVLFPTTYFYAWPCIDNNQKDPIKIAAWMRPESMALHHWHSAWQK